MTNQRRSTISSCVAVVAALLLLAVTSLSAAASSIAPPHLVVQITVDQLRGDMLQRYRHRFGPGGFQRLMDEGLYYTNAHYGTSNTFTASGHAVLVTGADTAEHGMVANEWFDRESGKVMYATADAKHGMSLVNLSSTTVSDELISASSGRARAYAVAGKDRSAIIPGGHRGKAFWFTEKHGAFASNTYYYDTLPAWVTSWNLRRESDGYNNQPWTRAPDPRRNRFARPKSTLSYSPFLEVLTASFARELITQERLGKSESDQHRLADYLSISFSATDYIGHAYGPNSTEYEENLLRLDATLAELFTFIDKAVGRNHTLIVLSADHGVDDIPEERRLLGFAADRFYPDKILARVNAALRKRFNVADDLVAAFVPPGLYLDRSRVTALKLDLAAVERALADEVRTESGIAYAFTLMDLLAGQIAHTPLLNKVVRSFHPKRSGDVIIVQNQFWYLYPDPEGFAAMHGSPYSYDTFVPVIFMGPGIEPRIVTRNIEPASIAPTLSALLGIKPPSGNLAPVLPEVLERAR